MARGPGRGGSRFSRQKEGRPAQYAEPEQAQQQQYQELERQQQTGMRYEEEDKYAGEAAHEAVSRDKGLQQHLSSVYGVLTGAVGAASLGSIGAMVTPLGMIPPFAAALGALGPWLYLGFMTNEQSHSFAFRSGLLGSGAFLSGMGMAPLLGMATAVNPMIVPMALGATTGMFGVMSVAALAAPKGRMASLGAPLFGGMIGLMGLGIAGMFCPVSSPWYPILHNVQIYGGLGIFSIYIAYDTQMMIQDYEQGSRDTIQPALNMFINLKIVFQRFLFIFIGRSD